VLQAIEGGARVRFDENVHMVIHHHGRDQPAPVSVIGGEDSEDSVALYQGQPRLRAVEAPGDEIGGLLAAPMR
jgi:hypothetical protein